MDVLEQITYLLFIRRLDDAHTLEENKALTLGKPFENRVFPAGKDEKGATIRTCAGPASRTSRRPRCTGWSASMCSLSCTR